MNIVCPNCNYKWSYKPRDKRRKLKRNRVHCPKCKHNVNLNLINSCKKPTIVDQEEYIMTRIEVDRFLKTLEG